jgi:hypothetical protein
LSDELWMEIRGGKVDYPPLIILLCSQVI